MTDRAVAVTTAIHWGAVLVYIVATVANCYGIFFCREGAERASYRIVLAALAVHGAAIAYWWYHVGHGPYMARHEVLSSNAWIMVVFFMAVPPGETPRQQADRMPRDGETNQRETCEPRTARSRSKRVGVSVHPGPCTTE